MHPVNILPEQIYNSRSTAAMKLAASDLIAEWWAGMSRSMENRKNTQAVKIICHVNYVCEDQHTIANPRN